MKYQEEVYYQFLGRAFPSRETVTAWSLQTSFLLWHPSAQPRLSWGLPPPLPPHRLQAMSYPWATGTAARCSFSSGAQILLLPLTYTTPGKWSPSPAAHTDEAPRHFDSAGMDTIEPFTQFLLLRPRLPSNHGKTSTLWLSSTKCLLERPPGTALGANTKSVFCERTCGHETLTTNKEKRFHTQGTLTCFEQTFALTA